MKIAVPSIEEPVLTLIRSSRNKKYRILLTYDYVTTTPSKPRKVATIPTVASSLW